MYSLLLSLRIFIVIIVYAYKCSYELEVILIEVLKLNNLKKYLIFYIVFVGFSTKS